MFKPKLKSYKILAVLFSVIIIITACFAFASAFKDPTSAPGDTMYTLEQIYCKLTNCTATTYGLDSPGTPVATMHTIEEVYTATPDFRTQGGTATAASIFRDKTAYSDSSTLLIGTLDLACNDPTFNGTANKVAGAYDGDGDGTNRWMMTDSGDAVASNIGCNKKAWVDGVEITGSNSGTCGTNQACVGGSCVTNCTVHANYGSTCTAVCGSLGKTCTSVGLDAAATNTQYKSSCNWAAQTCGTSIYAASCGTQMTAGTVGCGCPCGGEDCTFCRCCYE